MIVETSANQFYRVTETGNPNLAHVWNGVQVKRVKSGWADKAKARAELVRKDGCKIMEK